MGRGPNFVAKLKDGRLAAIEYKGAHLIAESAEKRAVGERWQASSAGRCVYVFAVKDAGGKDVRDQVRAAIAGS